MAREAVEEERVTAEDEKVNGNAIISAKDWRCKEKYESRSLLVAVMKAFKTIRKGAKRLQITADDDNGDDADEANRCDVCDEKKSHDWKKELCKIKKWKEGHRAREEEKAKAGKKDLSIFVMGPKREGDYPNLTLLKSREQINLESSNAAIKRANDLKEELATTAETAAETEEQKCQRILILMGKKEEAAKKREDAEGEGAETRERPKSILKVEGATCQRVQVTVIFEDDPSYRERIKEKKDAAEEKKASGIGLTEVEKKAIERRRAAQSRRLVDNIVKKEKDAAEKKEREKEKERMAEESRARPRMMVSSNDRSRGLKGRRKQ